MKLTFLGTRGYIEATSRRHRMHTALMVSYRRRQVMIDCGETWLGKLNRLSRRAIVITHAHPDHIGGLADGFDRPVFATRAAWKVMKRFPLAQRETIRPRTPREIAGITFEAFEVEHSLLAPAVGYRVSAGNAIIFYAPDVVYIRQRRAALAGVQIYIGDGATLTRPLVRRRGTRLIGHAPIQAQLTWCAKNEVPRAIITHCGTEIVTGEQEARARLEQMAERCGVEADIAYDGLEVLLR